MPALSYVHVIYLDTMERKIYRFTRIGQACAFVLKFSQTRPAFVYSVRYDRILNYNKCLGV